MVLAQRRPRGRLADPSEEVLGVGVAEAVDGLAAVADHQRSARRPARRGSRSAPRWRPGTRPRRRAGSRYGATARSTRRAAQLEVLVVECAALALGGLIGGGEALEEGGESEELSPGLARHERLPRASSATAFASAISGLTRPAAATRGDLGQTAAWRRAPPPAADPRQAGRVPVVQVPVGGDPVERHADAVPLAVGDGRGRRDVGTRRGASIPAARRRSMHRARGVANGPATCRSGARSSRKPGSSVAASASSRAPSSSAADWASSSSAKPGSTPAANGCSRTMRAQSPWNVPIQPADGSRAARPGRRPSSGSEKRSCRRESRCAGRGPVVGRGEDVLDGDPVALDVPPDRLDQHRGLARAGAGRDGHPRAGHAERALLLAGERPHRHRSPHRHHGGHPLAGGPSSRPARIPAAAIRAASAASATMRRHSASAIARPLGSAAA